MSSSQATITEPNTARLRDKDRNTSSVSSNCSLTASAGRERKASRQEWLDEIFDTARRRKLDLDRNQSQSPGLREEGGKDPLSNTAPQDLDRKMSERGKDQDMDPDMVESSADEETFVFRRRSGSGDDGTMNYQSTVVQPQQQGQQRPGKRGGVRNQPSTTSIRKRGRTHDPGLRTDDEEEDEHESWWARMLSNYGSLELENKGSVARDHLALERTFLAWLRTSLAFASIGIAITQLFRLNTTSAADGGADPYKHLRQMGKPLGATFLGISIVMLGVGFHRYFESQHWIIRGKFPASRGSIALVAAITFALSITSLVVVIVVEPGQFERK